MKSSEDLLKLLKPISDIVGVAVDKLWSVFVRKYIARGISELFLAVIISVIAFYFKDINVCVAGVLAIAAATFVFSAIQLVVNPSYYALMEITNKIKENR